MRVVLDHEAMYVAKGVFDKTQHRPVLECVKIGNGEIASADGFILVTKPVAISDGDKPILVKGSTLLKAERLFRPNDCLLECVDNSVTLKAEKGVKPGDILEPDITITDRTVEGNFPQYGALFPKEKPIAELALDARLLKKLLNAIGEENLIRFRIRGNSDKEEIRVTTPVEFCAGETNGLIMPMFVELGGNWHKSQ